jgi:hypothetical protein
VARATSFNKQWLENRREAIDARMNDLDFFGAALEDTPSREKFWPSYERLADTVLSLRQAVLACMETNETRGVGQSACLHAARRHVADAALHLFQLTQDQLLRRSIKSRRSEFSWLDQLSRRVNERHDGLEAKWDDLLKAYDAVLRKVRLAHIACPTGGMDQ